MSDLETQVLLTETANRLFAELVTPELLKSTEAGVWPKSVWQSLEDHGLTLALASEAAGGAGCAPTDVSGVLFAAGHTALPVPLVEAMIAAAFLSRAGIAIGEGVLSVAADDRDALELRRDGSGWRLSGTCHEVPWGRHAAHVAALVETKAGLFAVRMPGAAHVAERGANYADEPRDTLRFNNIELSADDVAQVDLTRQYLRHRMAAFRSAQLAGALENALAICVNYVQERKQFGKALASFQAIQQQLAQMAGECAAASAAARIGLAALDGSREDIGVATAKIRTSEAATISAGIAHQVHGAIGFTREYALQNMTRRLWSWRDEAGGERQWSAELGARFAASGRDGFWALITATR